MMEWYNRKNEQERISFNVEDMNDIVGILNEYSSEPIEIGMMNPYSIYFSNQNHELNLKSSNAPVQTLTIKKIRVEPAGQGIGTIILNVLIKYAKSVGFDRIVMEQVTSDEGLHFVKNRGFSICYTPSMEIMPISYFDYEKVLYYDFDEVVPMRISDLCRQHNTTVYGISKGIKNKYNINIQSTINEIMQKRTKAPTIGTIFYISEALGISLKEFFIDPKFNQIDGIDNITQKIT